MERIRRGADIVNAVNKVPYEGLIRTEEIANQFAKISDIPYDKAKAAVNVRLKRMADAGTIRRIQKGVYCHVRQTAFGAVAPDLNKVMVKALTRENGRRIGYESGASFLNRMGLTTLLPRAVEITTNQYSEQLPDGCHIKLKRPVTEVSEKNWKYLQFIDMIRNIPDSHIDAEDPQQIIRTIMKKQEIDPLTLVLTARKYYPAKTVLRLTDLLMEGHYGSAQ